jgi:hypothetical protein
MNNKKIKLNIQRISDDNYLIFYPFNEVEDCGRGLIYSTSTNNFENEESAKKFSFARRKDEVKQLALKNLPEKTEKSIQIDLGDRLWMALYESDCNIILYDLDTFTWIKMTSDQRDWELKTKRYGFNFYFFAGIFLEKWPHCNLNSLGLSIDQLPMQPLNGKWFELDIISPV